MEGAALPQRYWRAACDSLVRGGASFLLGGLTPMLAARALGPRDYGAYALVTALTACLAGLLQMGQHAALHKLLPEYFVSDRTRGGALLVDVVLLTLAAAMLLALALLVGAELLALQVYHEPMLTGVLRGGALLLGSLALFNLATSAAAGLQDFKTYNTALLVRSAAAAAAVCLGVMLWGLWGALAGQFVANVLGAALLVRSSWTRARERFAGLLRPDFSRATLGALLAAVAPAFVMTLLNLPGYWWLSTLLAREHGLAEAGKFSAAYALAQLIWLAPLTFYVPALAFLSEARAVQPELFGQLAGANVRIVWLLTLPLALGGALSSPLLLRLCFGAAYADAALAASLLSLTALLMGLVGLFNTMLAAAGRLWGGCAITFSWALSFGALSLLCVPRWGATGGAAAYALSHIVYLLGAAGYARAALGVRCAGWRRLALLTASGLLLTALIWLVCTGAAFYLSAALLLLALLAAEWFWVGNSAERLSVRQTLKRGGF